MTLGTLRVNEYHGLAADLVSETLLTFLLDNAHDGGIAGGSPLNHRNTGVGIVSS